MSDGQDAPTPGIYYDVPFDEYAAWPHLNQSRLKEAGRSMAHFRHARPVEETPALRLGTLCHEGAFSPLSLPRRFAVMPDFASQVRRPDGSKYDNPKASKAYKQLVSEFTLANLDKQIVPADVYDTMVTMVEALAASADAQKYLGSRGPVEVSLVWDDPETGIRCKARIDKYSRDVPCLTDLKTCANLLWFGRSIGRWRYDVQAAWYCDGWQLLTGEALPFALVAVESTGYPGVMAAQMSDEDVDAGRRTYRAWLRQIAECLETDHWPGYDSPECWRVPNIWTQEESEDQSIGDWLREHGDSTKEFLSNV